MASRQKTSILTLVVLLGALAVPSAHGSSFRGSRALDEASGHGGEKRVGAVLVNASEERVSSGSPVNVSFRVAFAEGGEAASSLTVLGVSQEDGRAFATVCKIDADGTVLEKCIDEQDKSYVWKAEVKAPGNSTNTTSTTTAPSTTTNNDTTTAATGANMTKSYMQSGDKKSHDKKEDEVTLMPAADGLVNGTISVSKNTEGLSLLFLNRGIKNVTVSNLTVGGRAIPPPKGADAIIVPAANSTAGDSGNMTTATAPSVANVTSSPTANNTTGGNTASGALN